MKMPNDAPVKKVAVIDVTDLYHPHQDEGDNFDIIAPYALPEIDLRAVILDCTQPFRQPVALDAGEGLFPDDRGPRDPGFIPVLQLNYIFNRNVPCAVGPFSPMKSPADPMVNVPGFQQQGIELILRTLRESKELVHIMTFSSVRSVAAAYNRDPQLFKDKLALISMSAGASGSDFLEWNVALDRHAVVCLLRSDLPIAIFPDASAHNQDPQQRPMGNAFSYDPHNTYWSIPNLHFIKGMHPRLRRYLDFAFGRVTRMDFLRAMDEDFPENFNEARYNEIYRIWETALWIIRSGRRLVRRADGNCRIIPPSEMIASDVELPNELRPCEVTVRDDGIYSFKETSTPGNRWVYYRGDPKENEAALREALPALYQSFRP
jgi:pyrimidine-specific ribonucleoside hydrolase